MERKTGLTSWGLIPATNSLTGTQPVPQTSAILNTDELKQLKELVIRIMGQEVAIFVKDELVPTATYGFCILIESRKPVKNRVSAHEMLSRHFQGLFVGRSARLMIIDPQTLITPEIRRFRVLARPL